MRSTGMRITLTHAAPSYVLGDSDRRGHSGALTVNDDCYKSDQRTASAHGRKQATSLKCPKVLLWTVFHIGVLTLLALNINRQ